MHKQDDRIPGCHRGAEPTLLVCHGGICRMLRTYFLDVPNEDYAAFKMPNCGVLEFDL